MLHEVANARHASKIWKGFNWFPSSSHHVQCTLCALNCKCYNACIGSRLKCQWSHMSTGGELAGLQIDHQFQKGLLGFLQERTPNPGQGSGSSVSN
eukprot:3364156-Amphidinium_carterae.1